MEDRRVLRIELALEVSMPESESFFQSLVLAFWRFQGLAATELFTATLRSIEERLWMDLMANNPGRYRHKGRQSRTWRLPFGTVKMPLLKIWDRTEKRMVMPLKEALGLPTYLRWTEDSLLPGYRLALIQSFRKSVKALDGMGPRGATPSPSTLHRRFQGFADKLDPVPDLSHKRGPKPSAYQMADGTRIKLQQAGHDAGGTDIRLVVGSRTPQGKLEVLDVSVGDSWDTVAQRLRKRFPSAPKALVSDGEEGIPLALMGPETVHQRCLFHVRRGLDHALYQDGFTKLYRQPFRERFETVDGLHITQNQLNDMDADDQDRVRQLLQRSEKAFQELKAGLPADLFPHTVAYLTGLIEDSLAYLRYLLQTGKKILLSSNRLESIWSRVVLRIKKIGRRWSRLGALRMLAATLLYVLHPDRYREIEAQIRGEHMPHVSLVITSLKTEWIA
jgi:hypothetical protein